MVKRGELETTIEVSPDFDSVAESLDELGDALGDFRPVWRRVAGMVGQNFAANISSEGNAVGENWPKPHPDYARQKSLEGFPDDQLVATGDLERKLAAGRVIRMGRDFVFVGLEGKDAKKAAALHFGSKRTGLRARPFVEVNAASRRKIEGILTKYVAELVRRHIRGVSLGG